MRKLLLAPVFALMLAACTVGGHSVLVSCEVYAGALKTLAIERASGNLSDSQVATVNKWRPILNGVCLAETPPAGTDAFDTLEAGLIALARIQGGS